MTSTELTTELARIGSLDSVQELRGLLVEAMSVTVEKVVQVAVIVRRLEELGDDLSDIEISILPNIRKVAYGQVAPELIVGLQGRPALLSRAVALPLPDQQSIATGKPLKVYEAGGDHRMVPPLKLTNTEVQQVFAKDHLRDAAEQASWLRERTQQRTPKRVDDDEVYLDHKRQGIWIGKRFIPMDDMAHYLSQLASKAKRPRRVPAET